MKKFFLIATLALSTLVASAQEGLQGVNFVGASLSYNYDKVQVGNENLKNQNYGVMPLVGTFITPSVAVGGAIGYNYDKNPGKEYATTGGKKTNLFTVQPLVRKYFNIAGGFYFFGQLALPVTFGNTKDYEGNKNSKVSNFGMALQLRPGFDYIVNDWISVEATFQLANAGFNRTSPKEGGSNTAWGIDGNSINSSKFGDLAVGVKFLF